MAYGLDKPTRRQEDRVLAWERIEAVNQLRDSQTYDLYQRKKKAYKPLQEDRYIEAYYLFKDLAAEYLGIQTSEYMAIAEQRAMGVSFPGRSAEGSHPGRTRNILFLNGEQTRTRDHFHRQVRKRSVKAPLPGASRPSASLRMGRSSTPDG
jgi:hypothetical protein